MFLHFSSKKDVSPIRLHDVTFDSQTHLSHTREIINRGCLMRRIWWFFFSCLPLAFKLCPQTLAPRPSLDAPTHVRARTRRAHFLPPLHLSVSSHTSVQRNGYFCSQQGEAEEETSHVEFIKQFECDYVNELCLIRATVRTSGVHTGCDKFHSYTAVHVCGGCLWLLNRSTVWGCPHLNSSHTRPKVRVLFFFWTEGNERENVQVLLSSQTRRAAAVVILKGETLKRAHCDWKSLLNHHNVHEGGRMRAFDLHTQCSCLFPIL